MRKSSRFRSQRNLSAFVMKLSKHERALLPLGAFQAATITLGGFIGFFVVGNESVDAMFQYSALMLTFLMASLVLSYAAGPFLKLSSAHIMKIGFFVPGALLLSGFESVFFMAAAFGILQGCTFAARHMLEMSLLPDAARDGYESKVGAISVAGGVAATLCATLVLSVSSDSRQAVYAMYGVICLAAGFLLGRHVPRNPLPRLKNPLGVVRQRDFIACLPLYFLQTGLMGLGLAVGAVASSNALESASSLGWVGTAAGLAGGAGLFLTRNSRSVDNRARWLCGTCMVSAFCFALLGASAWIPVLFVVCTLIQSAIDPFLWASLGVLNLRAMDIQGEVNDRIVVREIAYWVLRMASLCIFWLLAGKLTPAQLLATGSAALGCAVFCQYLVGKSILVARSRAQAPAPAPVLG